MDHNREESIPKIPFYMTYPMQNMYLMEREYKDDMERMKSMCTTQSKKMIICIEERLDELEYEGSRIYDEEVDPEMVKREVAEVCARIQSEPDSTPPMEQPTVLEKSPKQENRSTYFDMVPAELIGCARGDGRPPRRTENSDMLQDLVTVLFLSELYQRRCRNRCQRRWW